MNHYLDNCKESANCPGSQVLFSNWDKKDFQDSFIFYGKNEQAFCPNNG